MSIEKSKLSPRTTARVLFVDMNSFFASCEQQDNYWLRNRPVGVCVYTGKTGCIIAPSIEAKKRGVKTGMRLNEAILICPDLVPVQTNPDRYRNYHIKIMNILKSYCSDVYPKSIDEAIVDLTNYELIYPDVIQVAKKIKLDIQQKVGDWLKCSIGVAPNAFLAKLASDIQKPDGLTILNPHNIDTVLGRLKLTDLSGVARNTADRLTKGGIKTPLQMRHASAENLKAIFKSILGFYWHCRLNFIEVDLNTNNDYKSMQAMRQLSKEQRQNFESVNEILVYLCLTLERRLMKRRNFAGTLGCHFRYLNGDNWDDFLRLSNPIQDAAEIYRAIKERMEEYETKYKEGSLLNSSILSISLFVGDFTDDTMVQYNLFEDNSKKDKLRKTVYDLKHKFGKQKVLRAVELKEGEIMQDVIGFGSVKDLYDDDTAEFIM
ncbi:MAG: DNA polymerase IV [Bacteroidota bacterium]